MSYTEEEFHRAMDGAEGRTAGTLHDVVASVHGAHRVAERYSILLGNRGRLVLPAEVRRRLDLHDGDRIILSTDEEGSVRLVSAWQAARRTRGLRRRIAPALQDRRLAEELIAERRAEAARE
ncbi:MAG: AbrB/MazE/SpoVT family DNA-binding domain-containing protein [Pseudomonadota bacterium]|nr:AbrB/MazE/SpoVT family DNA-binding domain-containing protein [Pseudomonadota bacterium]